MPVALILLIPVILISVFCVGLVALSRNIALLVRLYFSFAILGVIQWVVALYFSNIDSSFALFFNRSVYVGPVLALLFFGLFIDTFYLRKTRRLRKLNTASVLVAVLAVVLALTKYNVAGITPRLEEGDRVGYNIVPGPLSLVVLVALLFLSASLFVRLVLAYRRADDVKKRPLKLVLRTLVFAVVISLATNALAPILIGGSSIANAISNLTIIIFVSTVAYTVLRYSFLDIRLLVVRSVAYVAGLATLLLMATLLEIVVFNSLGGGLAGKQLLFFSVLLSAAVLGFGPLRSLFVKVTAKVLYKDAYDSSGFIASFNGNLINNIELDKLLTSSASLIEQALKSTFCVIGVAETERTAAYLFGTKLLKVSHEDQDTLSSLPNGGSRVTIQQQSEGTHGNQSLEKTLKRYDIEALARLVVTSGSKEKGIGFVALGPKKNGEAYNKTDMDTLVIIANELVLAVQNALRFKEIQKFNLTLQEKIDEATKKLRRTNERLRVLDQTKDDFISMASHQLRTPLTSVKGYVSMVLEGDAGKISTTQRKLLTQSFLSSQRMVYLISDLLNVSRLKTGKFIIEPVPSNLSKVIEEEVDQLTETVKARNLELTYHKPEHFPTLMLDETKIRQVIMNFIDNAVYYTPAGGHINVYLADKPESIEFTVVDDGIGVPRHEQHHLFSKFYRAHNAKRARPDGTGLGIFMAKKVVIAQGGAVIFKSAEGKGSTFGFTFPKSKLLSPAKDAAGKH